jgi:uncharacterized membrane protein YfcA
METDLAFWIAGGLAAFVIGASKGGLTSAGMLAVPIMALVMSPVAAAGLLLPLYIISDMFGLWAFRREYSADNIRIILVGAIAGILIGWQLASIVPEPWVRLAIGLIGIAFCLDRFLKRGTDVPPRPADWPRGLFWGTLTGFTSFVSHSGGPPFQVYVLPQRLPKMVYAGTVTIVFAAVNLLKLPPYIALGQVSLDNGWVTLGLALFAVAGVFAGLKLTRVIPERIFYSVVTVMLFLVSLKLTWDASLTLLGYTAGH